jgi:hypothetical protein
MAKRTPGSILSVLSVGCNTHNCGREVLYDGEMGRGKCSWISPLGKVLYKFDMAAWKGKQGEGQQPDSILKSLDQPVILLRIS